VTEVTSRTTKVLVSTIDYIRYFQNTDPVRCYSDWPSRSDPNKYH